VWVAAAAIIVGVGVIAATFLAVRLTGQDDGVFTRDVRAVASDQGADLPVYTGVISILNNMVWIAAAVLAVCAAAFDDVRRQWHLVFAALLLILAIDDSLMLHESSGSIAIELGFYVVYCAVGLWLLWASVQEVRDTSRVAFIIGSGFLAMSSFFDVFTHGHYLAEDGAKLLGALMWLTVPVGGLVRIHAGTLAPTGEPVTDRLPVSAPIA
jgi:hypothetical protein